MLRPNVVRFSQGDIGHQRARWLRTLMSVMLASVGCDWHRQEPSAVVPQTTQAEIDDPVAKMRSAMAIRDWRVADGYARQVMIGHSMDPNLITDVAKVAAFCDRKRDAAHLLVDAAELAGYAPTMRVDFAVQALIDVGELYPAIELLERSLIEHPENSPQRRTLVGFLGEAHLVDRVPSHFLQLIRDRNFDFPLLVSVTETSFRRFSDASIDLLMQRNPADHRVKLGRARERFDQYDVENADKVLAEILQHHPEFAPAHALFGQVLVNQRRFSALPDWMKSASAESAQFADYWLTLGDWAIERSQPVAAVRAYWEATQRDPNRPESWARLAQAARTAGSDQKVNLLSEDQLNGVDERVTDLLELRARFYRFSAGGRKSQNDAVDVAEKLTHLGRYWEAEAWTAAATGLIDNTTERLSSLRQRIIDTLKQDSRWLVTDERPALTLNFANLVVPDFLETELVGAARRSTPSLDSDQTMRLVDASKRWGLSEIGANSNPSDPRLAALIRSTGVGGGAIDFDMDGFADTIVMGAGGSMHALDSMPNQLLRNLGNHFIPVTENAGVVDRGFGQGVAVGDYNEDGFSDLFFSNLGRNRLFCNRGDGTFVDRSDCLNEGTAERWTTSAAFLDANRDGFSDLVMSNYCEIVEDLDQPCTDSQGNLGPCYPLQFPAESDCFYFSTGDGEFVDVTSQWANSTLPRRGLGIVAGALDGSNLAVFIANDISANDYYSVAKDDTTRWIESAVARGVAVDERTLTQGSMGIAASDFDVDGDLDLYVTGFSREYNIFYEQVSPGYWRDSTARMNLIQPTLNMVGFGTQAIDIDCDGVDEIIVSNGHIGQFSNRNEPPYEQLAQVFRRHTTGTYRLVNSESWGGYFSRRHAGRSLWTADVNADGRSDVLITHTIEPISLLLNDGPSKHNVVAFKLVGTRSSRDAVGSIVRFHVNGRQRKLWCLSGDGYMCSNERILRAGVGNSTRIENVSVAWPDGSIDELGSLDVNTEYILIQDELPFACRKY